MAESDPPTPAAEPTPAQAEFARFKNDTMQPTRGAAAGFATPLPTAAVPAWSLAPAHPAPPPSGHGPGWGPAPSSGTGYASIIDGVGSTIRLGVEVLNAALSSSIVMLNAAGGWGRESYGYADPGGCGGGCGYDCCAVLGAGCGCCEPSVGSCC